MLTYQSNAQIRRDLLDAFIEARPPVVAYPAIFPQLPVPSRAGAIKYIPFSQVNTAPTSVVRTPGQAYGEAAVAMASAAYLCEDIGRQLSMDMAQEYPDGAEASAAVALRYQLEAAIEARAVSALLTDATPAISTANNNLTNLTTAWSDPTVDPVAGVQAAMEVVASRTGGILPNLLVVSPQLFTMLKTNPAIISRVSHMVDRSDETVAAMLAPIFGVERVVVSRARSGASQVWPADTAVLAVAAMPGDLASVPSACREVYWVGDGEPDSSGWVVETVDDEPTRSHIVRARKNAALLVISPSGLYGLVQP